MFSKQQSQQTLRKTVNSSTDLYPLFGLWLNKRVCLDYSYSIVGILLELQGYFWKLNKVWIHLNYIFME